MKKSCHIWLSIRSRHAHVLSLCIGLLFFLGACTSTDDTSPANPPPLDLSPVEIQTRVVAQNLDVPWELIWGPDNFLWVSERKGNVLRINPANGDKQVILDLTSQVWQSGESGLLGMVLHPDFQANPFVYLVYTYQTGSGVQEKLVQYQYASNALSNPTVLLDNLPANSTHNGSRLLVLPDKTLLMTTGDIQNAPLAQDIRSLSGKILRLNLNGSVPTDNPIAGSYVYSFGHRNPQGLLWHPNGKLYATEHGPDIDDELNIIVPNRNFGWPNIVGTAGTDAEKAFAVVNNTVEPMLTWTPTVAISDLALYTSTTIPQFQNSLLITTLKARQLLVVALNEDGTQVRTQEILLNNQFGRLRDIVVSPQGKIYVATNGESWSNTDPGTHQIIELSPK